MPRRGLPPVRRVRLAGLRLICRALEARIGARGALTRLRETARRGLPPIRRLHLVCRALEARIGARDVLTRLRE
ncbi:hypothetical protein L6E12_29220, partial [Actinokineospora sp. PR83]|uniref:hypothetical protein n=1 Tax=Actinokineospora sp. PR83 TaxID=2884908 RepID=UPI001F3C581C